jgi:hypothetical protein
VLLRAGPKPDQRFIVVLFQRSSNELKFKQQRHPGNGTFTKQAPQIARFKKN